MLQGIDIASPVKPDPAKSDPVKSGNSQTADRTASKTAVPATESSPTRSDKLPADSPVTESSANRPDAHAPQSAQRTTRGLASEVPAKETQTKNAHSSDVQPPETHAGETRASATVKDSAPASDDDPQGAVSNVPIDSISRGTYQPRVHFDPESLQELADSITAQGLIQPILLRRRGGGFELIAGERRWRAAQLAGLSTIPAIVREMDDHSVAAVTLIENIQREDLNPLEEARALHRLKNEFSMTDKAVAEAVGRSRAAVTNLIRLLDLDERVSEMLATGKIEMGHARALLTLPADQQHAMAMKVYAEGLSVRATESLARGGAPARKNSRKSGKKPQDSHIKALESQLSEKLGATVSIDHTSSGKGNITVSYNSLDELDGILSHIN